MGLIWESKMNGRRRNTVPTTFTIVKDRWPAESPLTLVCDWDALPESKFPVSKHAKYIYRSWIHIRVHARILVFFGFHRVVFFAITHWLRACQELLISHLRSHAWSLKSNFFHFFFLDRLSTRFHTLAKRTFLN